MDCIREAKILQFPPSEADPEDILSAIGIFRQPTTPLRTFFLDRLLEVTVF